MKVFARVGPAFECCEAFFYASKIAQFDKNTIIEKRLDSLINIVLVKSLDQLTL
ncbi:MAG: hypothetical protein MUC94_04820 [bacterium]|jgi:hypothetical protein|nr:hypothetical protein [bacterium]